MKSLLLAFVIGCAALVGCSSAQTVKTQQYAPLKTQKTFEDELPKVWAGIETAMKDYAIRSRDPKEVDPIEFNSLKERSLETDWIYSQSRDKYVEYKVNDFPRKKYLQIRVKYEITAKRIMGGTNVSIETEEEIEKLKSDGSSAGYDEVNPDTSRPNELLEKINLAILKNEGR